MINEIKTIVQNYLNNIKLCSFMVGTVAPGGIKVSDKLTIPLSLVSGNYKKFINTGDKVRLLRNLGGQEFYILEIIDKDIVLGNTTMNITPFTIEGTTISSIEVKEVIK